ncbi:MAG: hypothetical protein GY812_00835 [Actinomycetia bacterium]|nr:hypothetical protein [Actinomycetes bacterium]
MNAPGLIWLVRALWLALPFTLLEGLLSATEGSADATRITVQALFWLLWAAGFVVSLVPLPSTLTALRIIAPVAPAAALGAVAVEAPEAAGWTGLGICTLAAVLSMSSIVGDWFIDGGSWGEERRFALKAPVALLLGPVPLAWVLTTVPVLAGIVLFAAEVYAAAIPLVLIGIVTVWWGSFALWRLARRWLVFVPAGVTLVDDMALAEPVLFPSRAISRVGPAHVDTSALDLTVKAPGLVVEIDFAGTVEVTLAAGRDGTAQAVDTEGVLIVPSRPGTAIAHAEQRGLAVARD